MLPASEPLLKCSYSYSLVALSVLIAAMASYAAFNFADRLAAYRYSKRLGWLAGGAVAMGIGIWSMHYTGMLAFSLPLTITYHVPTVALSLVASVLGSAVALSVVSEEELSARSAIVGGSAMGAAISMMHYIGMAAMRGRLMHHYSPVVVALSVLVAVTFSCIALWLMFYFSRRRQSSSWLKLLAAVVMGCGIASMHYTAMAAATFARSDTAHETAWTVGVSQLALAGVVAATLLVLVGALLTSWLDRRLSFERLTRQVLESVNGVLWRADGRTLRLNFISSEARRVLGDTMNLGENATLWINQIHPEDVSRVRAQYHSAAQKNEGSQLDYRFIKSDGQTVWLREIVHATTRHGFKQLIGLTRDVTDSKMLEQALVAEEKLAALGRLSATIAHEINNPLQAALNLLYMVAGETTDQQSRRFVTMAQQEVRRAAEIAKRTLGFYRGADSPCQIDFSRVLNDLSFLYEPELHNKGVKLLTRVSSGATWLGSEGEIRQILSNLLSNALDAIPANGTINMRISRSRDWSNGLRPGVRMTVFDNGKGILPQNVNRVFLPFFTTKADVGTGLGLWVVKQLAEKYKGHISIRSSQGISTHGTAISIFLAAQSSTTPKSTPSVDLPRIEM